MYSYKYKIPILHRYLLRSFWSSFGLSLSVFVSLFFLIDFFDRIDKVLEESPPFLTIVQYFGLKIPVTISVTLPIAGIIATLFSVGILSKNSETTAMRASGISLWWIGKPLFISSLVLVFLSIILNETVVPYAARRSREIYNIDIKQKDKSGWYSQNDFWWRSGDDFYSVRTFDSRSNKLLGITKFSIDSNFMISKRTDAKEAHYVDPLLGWTMKEVVHNSFLDNEPSSSEKDRVLPLPIKRTPADFYDVETDPQTMSFTQLRRFMRTQSRNGLPISNYYADLYDKLAFPFVNFIVVFAVFPFALIPARSGSMASSVMAALLMGFSYYVVHSLTVALGRAEMIPAFASAWIANLLLVALGFLMIKGTESPQ